MRILYWVLIPFAIAVITVNLMMNVSSGTREGQYCMHPSGVPLLAGYPCTKNEDVTIQKIGWPFAEKVIYRTKDGSILNVTCTSTNVNMIAFTAEDTPKGLKCPSWARNTISTYGFAWGRWPNLYFYLLVYGMLTVGFYFWIKKKI